MKNIIFIILLVIKCIDGVQGVDRLVTTAKGRIRGLQGDGDYTMFLGVPYAVVDVNNPFGAATPHPGFNETFQAYDDGATCPQFIRNAAIGTIQCLQLNIYVPSTASACNKTTVMVYVHGGGFVQGVKAMSGVSAKFLVSHEVIVVSINYRLGPYGFLCLSEPGFNNQGLKDQVLALKWVKDNIGAFGGDVERITAFGISAGAMTLDIQLLVNEDLIQRAIIQSGPALTTWVIATQNDSIPLDIAGKLGYTGKTVKAALEYLSNKDPIEVIQSANDLDMLNLNTLPLTIRPCVETVGDDALLTDFPINLKPKVNGMDLMIGNTNKEVMFIYPKQTDTAYYKNYRFADELARHFDGIYDEDTIRRFYIGDKVLGPDLQSDILDYGSDFAFYYPTERTVERYLNANASRVYSYIFSYEGGRNKMKIMYNLTSPGAAHGDDLAYLFEVPLFKNKVPNEDDQNMIDIMTTMWTNFAKYGDPTPSKSDLISVRWLPGEALRRPFLNINKPITLDYRPFNKRMAFWELYYKLHGDKEKGYKGVN